MIYQKFDIVIIGAGCAGMQLLQQLAQLKNWPNYQVLLIDDGAEKQQSWCFWSASDHPLQHLITKTWHQLAFSAAGFLTCQSIDPYAYHYIPGKAFFDYFNHQFIPAHLNITVFKAQVTRVRKVHSGYMIEAPGQQWWGQTCYSSLIPEENSKPELWQHFKGCYIEAEQEIFDTNKATLMDYSVQLYDEVHFIYVLPFSKKSALVEATFFSAQIADEAVYDKLIKHYLKQTFPDIKFKVISTETGSIPMSPQSYSRYGAAGEILIGKAAGMVKASTGYTLNRITKDSILLAKQYGTKANYPWPRTKGRFRFYDQLLLGLIRRKPQIISDVFTHLFKYNPTHRVLQFLDEQTNPVQEFSIFFYLPWGPFLRQAVNHLSNRNGKQ